MEHNSFRLIANPYLLKNKNSTYSYKINLSRCLHKKYPNMDDHMINEIISYIDNYYQTAIIQNILNDLILSVIKFDSITKF